MALERRTMWYCTECGNLRFCDERPTRCYHCRQGESELSYRHNRLFDELPESQKERVIA